MGVVGVGPEPPSLTDALPTAILYRFSYILYFGPITHFENAETRFHEELVLRYALDTGPMISSISGAAFISTPTISAHIESWSFCFRGEVIIPRSSLDGISTDSARIAGKRLT